MPGIRQGHPNKTPEYRQINRQVSGCVGQTIFKAAISIIGTQDKETVRQAVRHNQKTDKPICS